MTFFGLIKNSIVYYRRRNIAIVLVCAVAASVLVGALVVGDSVRHTLSVSLAGRLGKVDKAVIAGDRFFRASLGDDLEGELGVDVAPALVLSGIASDEAGTVRVNNIRVIGVDDRFFAMGPGGDPFGGAFSEGVVVNAQLGRRLGVEAGDEVLLRVGKPSAMPRDIPLTPGSDMSVAFRLKVRSVASASEFGNFNLTASQIEPLNAFVSIGLLAEKIDRAGLANMLLVAEGADGPNEAIGRVWELADMGAGLRSVGGGRIVELRSDRVFIDEAISDAAMRIGGGGRGVLTYFVNELSAGGKSCSYSMVSAVGGGIGSVIPAEMGSDEIIINQWLADDLGVKAGGRIRLKYYVLGKKRELIEEQSNFSVRGVVAMDSAWSDRSLMPELPGLVHHENCRDWTPGIPIDLSRIREKDEVYWDEFGGTPKAFVSLKAGQRMWGNRYGEFTSIRYRSDDVSLGEVAADLKSSVLPGSVGLYFRDVREQNENASAEASDFGGLFVGFSIFLIVSAVIIMALVFVFGVESRSGQIGMLRGLGYRRKDITLLLFVEGAILIVCGVCVGMAGGLLYTKAIIFGLSSFWRDAVGGSVIGFHAEPRTVLIGGGISGFVCLFGLWLSLRKRLRQSPCELMGQSDIHEVRRRGKSVAMVIGVFAFAVSVCLLLFADGGNEAVVFFGCGGSLLVGFIAITTAILKGGGLGKSGVAGSLGALAFRNCGRRAGRSLAVVILLACGSFMVVAVGANRHNPFAHAEQRDSGTGGFSLIGEASIGVFEDINTAAGRESIGLDEEAMKDSQVVAMRLYDGDDASCLNLNRPQKPRLLGIDVGDFQSRGAFGQVKTFGDWPRSDAWTMLSGNWGDDTVAAFGDHNTVVWMLGKSLGETIEYIDDSGRRFNIKIVGIFRNSVLQGSLLIDEDRFLERFSSQNGFKMFLVDSPSEKSAAVSKALSAGLRDFGLEVVAATGRLGELNAVENTYLSIFQMLGGLGLVLGSVGVAMVVVFNVLDRRYELAMLRAVGFDKGMLKRMVVCEHFALTLWGLFCGSVAAFVAVIPASRAPGSQMPYISLSITIASVAIAAMVWTWFAASMSLSGNLLEALRSE